MYIDLHESTRHTRQILVKRELSRQVFEKCTNMKFHENPSSGSRIVQFGRTDVQPNCSMRTDGRTADITSLIVAFRNFANAPKIKTHSRHSAVAVMTRLWAGQFGLQFLAQARDFSPLYNLQTVSAPPSLQPINHMTPGGFPGGKAT